MIALTYKKVDWFSCGNDREIRLVYINFKWLTNIIVLHLSSARGTGVRENQAVFRPCGVCIDQILALQLDLVWD